MSNKNKLNLKVTGNPFVDAGIFAVISKFKIDLEDITLENLYVLSKQISELYTNSVWQKNMHTIFPNSLLVNPSIKENRERLYLNYLNSLIEDITPINEWGDCVSCGCRTSINTFHKSAIPLSGSGSLKNFFPFAAEGVDYCPLCALLIQFSPLFMYRSGGKMILLHSNSNKVMKYWANKSLEDIDKQVSLDLYTGCFNENFTNPTNAVFRIIGEIVKSYDERWISENPSLNFYYFTNYNQGPELDLFIVPTSVFRFLVFIPSDESKNWNNIIRSAYKVNWDKVKEFDDYKNNPNEIYNRLLKNISILRFFYNFKLKKALCSWNLIRYYMMEVRFMDEKRLEAIKNMGDNLSDYIKNNDKKKVLTSLENASNYNSFRNILRKIIKGFCQ